MLAYYLAYGRHMLCNCFLFAMFCVRQSLFVTTRHTWPLSLFHVIHHLASPPMDLFY